MFTSDDPTAVREMLARYGRFIAAMEAIGPDAIAGAMSSAEAKGWARGRLRGQRETFARHPARSDRLDRVLDRAEQMLGDEPACFGHHQGVQLLTDGRRENFAVIDWGNCGAQWPRADLASAAANVGYVAQRAGGPADAVHWVIEGYLGDRPEPPELEDALRAWISYQTLGEALFRESVGQHDRAAIGFRYASELAR
jgi:Ser/Thr protein kinase RdoA (MazF antagonist)